MKLKAVFALLAITANFFLVNLMTLNVSHHALFQHHDHICCDFESVPMSHPEFTLPQFTFPALALPTFTAILCALVILYIYPSLKGISFFDFSKKYFQEIRLLE